MRDQCGLAGDAFSFAILVEPDVGKAPSTRKRLSFFHSLVPVDSRAHRYVAAVHVHGHTLVVNLFSDNFWTLHAGQKLLFGTDGAVVVHVNDAVSQQVRQSVYIFVLLGLVPGGFERDDPSLFPVGLDDC